MKTTYFASVPEWLLGEVSDAAVVVYCTLDRYADHKASKPAFPGYARLAKQLGRSESSVKRAARELEKAGALVREYRTRANGSQTTNLFWLRRDPPVTSEAGVKNEAPGGVKNEPPMNQSQYEVTATSSEVAVRGVEIDRTKAVKISGQNLPFNALADACKVDTRNRQQVSALTKALKDIRAYFAEQVGPAPGVTPEIWEATLAHSIYEHAKEYRRLFPNTECTPLALAKWWHRVEQHHEERRAGSERTQHTLDMMFGRRPFDEE